MRGLWLAACKIFSGQMAYEGRLPLLPWKESAVSVYLWTALAFVTGAWFGFLLAAILAMSKR